MDRYSLLAVFLNLVNEEEDGCICRLSYVKWAISMTVFLERQKTATIFVTIFALQL